MQIIGNSALAAVTALTASPLRSEKPLVAKPVIRAPVSIDEARALKAWAESVSDAPEPATLEQITRHLAFLSATLPSKAVDDESGKMRVAVYARILGDFSNDALSYMSRKACETYNWFPTPRQCLDILASYSPPTTEKERALMLCHRFWQGNFEDWLAKFSDGSMSQSDVDAVPEQWRRIAVERGDLRLMEDLTYVIRRA